MAQLSGKTFAMCLPVLRKALLCKNSGRFLSTNWIFNYWACRNGPRTICIFYVEEKRSKLIVVSNENDNKRVVCFLESFVVKARILQIWFLQANTWNTKNTREKNITSNLQWSISSYFWYFSDRNQESEHGQHFGESACVTFGAIDHVLWPTHFSRRLTRGRSAA